jgi:DNA-binding XRE family transcriptional regulator
MEKMPKISLAAVRVNAGFSQVELAEKMDVDRQTIINWEKGHTPISGEWFLMWAQICNFPVNYIFLPSESTKRRKKLRR